MEESKPEALSDIGLLERGSMESWLWKNKIKNEKGDPIDFIHHEFQRAIYEDQSDNLVVVKAAQVGMSTIEILKNFRDAERYKMDIIYTLPTDSDVSFFVGGKVNRIIANNPYLQSLTKDKDSIEQKQIGLSMIYFRGTWNPKAAIMITADRVVHDEKDTSKQAVIADFQSRMQHSKFKQTHVFSHPSVPNNGVDIEWRLSDQKEWFITCPHCAKKQILTWDTEDPKKMSIDIEKKEFVCKSCRGALNWLNRAEGEWMGRKDRAGAKWSGYHVSLLMNPTVTAAEIVEKYNDVLKGKQTMDFFYNKILGLPYAGSGNSLTYDDFKKAFKAEKNLFKGRLVMGLDSGVKLRYVIGNAQGLVTYGEMSAWEPDEKLGIRLEQTIEYFLIKFPNLVIVVDQGGDITPPRKLRAKYPGRVFLCHYLRDRKTMELVKWGNKDESGNVQADRNRMIQLVVNEIRDNKLWIFGTETDWYDYYLHYSHIYRVSEEDNLGVMQYKWLRNDRDDWVHATVYWRIGIMRFGQTGYISLESESPEPNSYLANPDQTVSFNPDDLFGKKGVDNNAQPWWADDESEEDWRGA